jgi:hypothetical protein
MEPVTQGKAPRRVAASGASDWFHLRAAASARQRQRDAETEQQRTAALRGLPNEISAEKSQRALVKTRRRAAVQI